MSCFFSLRIDGVVNNSSIFIAKKDFWWVYSFEHCSTHTAQQLQARLVAIESKNAGYV